MKISVSNFGVIPFRIFQPKNLDFNFAILLLYSKYLQIITWYRKSENSVTNCNLSLTLWHNPVYFGPQTERKIRRVHTHPRSIIVAIISPGLRRWSPLKFHACVEATEWTVVSGSETKLKTGSHRPKTAWTAENVERMRISMPASAVRAVSLPIHTHRFYGAQLPVCVSKFGIVRNVTNIT